LYKTKHYRTAVRQFKGALNFSSESPDAHELLYYSYLLSGQEGRSELVSRHFKGQLAERVEPASPKFLTAVYAEGVYSYFDNSRYSDQLWSTDEDGEWLLSRTFALGTLQFEHRPAPGITIRHSLSQLGKYDYYYLKDPDIRLLLPDHRVLQTAYWLSPVISTRIGFTLIPVLNLTSIRYETVSQVSTGFGSRSQVSSYYTAETALTGGLRIQQNFPYFDLSLNGLATAHNGSYYYQGGGSACLYPFANQSFYLKGGYAYKLVQSDAIYPVGGIVDLMTGFSVKDKVWIELSATKGYMFFYLDNDGSILYNNTDYPILKTGLQLIIPLDDYRKTLFIGGRFAVHNAYYGYTNEEDIPDPQEPIEYFSYTIYTGIKWKIQ